MAPSDMLLSCSHRSTGHSRPAEVAFATPHSCSPCKPLALICYIWNAAGAQGSPPRKDCCVHQGAMAGPRLQEQSPDGPQGRGSAPAAQGEHSMHNIAEVMDMAGQPKGCCPR